MNTLITADLHLTDKINDSYRWKFFPWIKKIILEEEVEKFIILGDLTDSKDKFSAVLVNRIIKELLELLTVKTLKSIIILQGNHDYIDKNLPYFKFINELQQNINFVTFPKFIDDDFFIPNQFDILTELEKVKNIKKNIVYLHHPFIGSKVSQFYELEHAHDIESFEKCYRGLCFSGDIHLPQKLKNVEYVGSPYPVAFGDNSTHRIILLKNNIRKDLEFPTIQKLSLDIYSTDSLHEYNLKAKDQIIITYNIDRNFISEKDSIQTLIKNFCTEKEIELNRLQFKIIKDLEIEKIKIKDEIVKKDKKTFITKFCEVKKLSDSYKNEALLLAGEND